MFFKVVTTHNMRKEDTTHFIIADNPVEAATKCKGRVLEVVSLTESEFFRQLNRNKRLFGKN